MEEDEVAQVVIVGILVLLVGEPIDGVGRDAGFSWNAHILTVLMRGVEGIHAEDFVFTVRIHNGNSRSEPS